MSRNVPCLCGSGLRVKACHGAIAVMDGGPESDGQTPPPDTKALVRDGLAAQRQNDLERTETLYRASLRLARTLLSPRILASLLLGLLGLGATPVWLDETPRLSQPCLST